jgi:hypothetical protein
VSVKDLRPALRAFLLGDTAIQVIVSGRVFPMVLPQGERRASIVYNRISGDGDHTMDGATGLARPRYQIDCWAADPDQAAALSNLVKSRIDGYRGTMGSGADQVTVQGVFLANEGDGYDADSKLYRDRRDYFINFEER